MDEKRFLIVQNLILLFKQLEPYIEPSYDHSLSQDFPDKLILNHNQILN